MGWWGLSPAYGGSNFSITLDGVYNRRLSGAVGHDNGSGGSLLLEYQPVDFLSLGAGLDTVDYWGTNTPGQTLVESVNLVGRIILTPDAPMPLYLMGEVGVNPKAGLPGLSLWPGNYHALAGFGTWAFLSPQLAIDLGAGFDFYTPMNQPLQNLQGRVGLSYFFAEAQRKNPKASLAPAQTVVMDVQSDVADPKTGTVKKAVITTKLEARTDIQKWVMEIKDQNGTILQTYAGKGVPPKQIAWEGKDSLGNLIPQGAHAEYRFIAIDNQGKVISSGSPLTVLPPTPPSQNREAAVAPVEERSALSEPDQKSEGAVDENTSPETSTPKIVWWDEPINPEKSFKKLKNQMVSDHIKRLRITLLGQKAESFFDEMRKREYKTSTIARMRASYYTAVASALQKKGLTNKADFYLKMALEIQPKNKEALALMEKTKP